ncbi:MAG: hypothetical protein Q9168_000124 [Polycauliona sp. 1 TL-2023]
MLPQLFQHPDYAEDQPSGYTILTLHCLHRGFTAGAIGGLAYPFARSAFTTILRCASHAPMQPWATRLISSAATGSLWGTGLTGIAMIGRMWGRDEIEWQDRSWRILANKTQNREDDWSAGGMLIGALALGLTSRRGARPGLSMGRASLGGAAVGSLLGTVGHVVTSSGSADELEDKVIAGEGPLAPGGKR